MWKGKKTRKTHFSVQEKGRRVEISYLVCKGKEKNYNVILPLLILLEGMGIKIRFQGN